MRLLNSSSPQKVFHRTLRGRAGRRVLSTTLGALLAITLAPHRAMCQSTTSLPFTYSIGSPTQVNSLETDNAWNVLTYGGSTYLVGFDPGAFNGRAFQWEICKDTSLLTLNCTNDFTIAVNPALPPPTSSPNWPNLGGDQSEGSYWPDGIYVDGSGKWYTAVHVEYNYNYTHLPNQAHFRGIGLATTTDQGSDWTWQGWIVTSSSPTDSINSFPG